MTHLVGAEEVEVLRDGCADGVVAVADAEDDLLVEVDQVVALQLLDEVGGDEAAPPVEDLAVVEAVLVDVAPHQDVVARVHLQLSLGRLVRGMLQRRINIVFMKEYFKENNFNFHQQTWKGS